MSKADTAERRGRSEELEGQMSIDDILVALGEPPVGTQALALGSTNDDGQNITCRGANDR